MTTYLTEPEVLVEFVDGLKRSAGACHALAHYQENPTWLQLRDLLESVIEQGQKLVVSKSMPRYQVLSELDRREKEARIEVPS